MRSGHTLESCFKDTWSIRNPLLDLPNPHTSPPLPFPSHLLARNIFSRPFPYTQRMKKNKMKQQYKKTRKYNSSLWCSFEYKRVFKLKLFKKIETELVHVWWRFYNANSCINRIMEGLLLFWQTLYTKIYWEFYRIVKSFLD